MENWGAIIYDYRKGLHTPERALVIAISRRDHCERGSVARKRLQEFITELRRVIREQG